MNISLRLIYLLSQNTVQHPEPFDLPTSFPFDCLKWPLSEASLSSFAFCGLEELYVFGASAGGGFGVFLFPEPLEDVFFYSYTIGFFLMP